MSITPNDDFTAASLQMDQPKISLSPGDILTQVGYSMNRHQPDDRVSVNTAISWRDAIEAALSVLNNDEQVVVLRRPRTREDQERLRAIARENIELGYLSTPGNRIGIPIRTNLDVSSLPSPKRSLRARDQLKEDIPSRPPPNPYPITLRANLENNALPLVTAHLTLSSIDDDPEQKP